MSGPKGRFAIVTLAIGDVYVAEWENFHKQSWLKYTQKIGADLIVITEPILPGLISKDKSIHWQKLLIAKIPQLQSYDAIAWVDSDISINYRLAPSIFDYWEPGKISAVDILPAYRADAGGLNASGRWAYLVSSMIDASQGEPIRNERDFAWPIAPYADVGLNFEAPFLNTGVLVFSPGRFAEFFATVFAKYPHNSPSGDFEQTWLSYEIISSGLGNLIDSRFNTIFTLEVAKHYPFLMDLAFRTQHGTEACENIMRMCVNTVFRRSYFLHFACHRDNRIIKRAQGMIDIDCENVLDLMRPSAAGA